MSQRTNASPHTSMTAAEAAARLNIQRPSLYSYVSRGILRRTVAEDGKTSLFDTAEVESLARSRRRGRPSLGTVDVMLATGLTRIADDGVWYRGTALRTIVGEWTFEQTAEWLWRGDESPGDLPPWPRPSALDRRLPVGCSPTMALLHVLAVSQPDTERTAPPHRRTPAGRAGAGISDHDADLRGVADAGRAVALARQLIVDFANSAALRPAFARSKVAAGAAIAERVAIRFGRPELAPTIDVVLTLMADHELASSTLAARVAASTRADVRSAVAAGLATLSGGLHGGVTRYSVALLGDAAANGAEDAVASRLAAGQRLAGFGHSVYRGIDPRAVILLDHLATSSLPPERLMIVEELMRAARRRISAAPNVDLALAAFVHAAELPADAAEWLFAIARTAGWVAHAIEEYGERPLRFRPRSVYVRERGQA